MPINFYNGQGGMTPPFGMFQNRNQMMDSWLANPETASWVPAVNSSNPSFNPWTVLDGQGGGGNGLGQLMNAFVSGRVQRGVGGSQAEQQGIPGELLQYLMRLYFAGGV